MEDILAEDLKRRLASTDKVNSQYRAPSADAIREFR